MTLNNIKILENIFFKILFHLKKHSMSKQIDFFYKKKNSRNFEVSRVGIDMYVNDWTKLAHIMVHHHGLLPFCKEVSPGSLGFHS